MKKIKIKFLINTLLVSCLLVSCTESNNGTTPPKNIVFQNSTVSALAEGLYKGGIPFADLKKHGNLGLGAFHDLDGEMVAFDGVFYQIKSDGSINVVSDEQLTPFSVVTNFMPDDEVRIKSKHDYKALVKMIDDSLPSPNYMYAFRIDGVFNNVSGRSAQRQKTRMRLIDLIPNQEVFKYEEEIKGTIVGFYFPSYMKDINVVGYHFHFLSDDKTKGGHLIDLETQDATIKIDYIHEFKLIVPENEDFKNVNLDQMEENELDTIEKK